MPAWLPTGGARDAWTGWDEGEWSAGIGRLVGLNRFLIRPSVRCANLASKVLSRCLGWLSGDAQARYGVYARFWWKRLWGKRQVAVSADVTGYCRMINKVGDEAVD